MQTHSLLLPKRERAARLEEVWQKRDCNCYFLCIALSHVTSKTHTPQKLTNQIGIFLHHKLTPPVL